MKVICGNAGVHEGALYLPVQLFCKKDCHICQGKGYTVVDLESLLASERSKVIAEVKHLVENIYGDQITVHELYAKLDSMEADKV